MHIQSAVDQGSDAASCSCLVVGWYRIRTTGSSDTKLALVCSHREARVWRERERERDTEITQKHARPLAV